MTVVLHQILTGVVKSGTYRFSILRINKGTIAENQITRSVLQLR